MTQKMIRGLYDKDSSLYQARKDYLIEHGNNDILKLSSVLDPYNRNFALPSVLNRDQDPKIIWDEIISQQFTYAETFS